MDISCKRVAGWFVSLEGISELERFSTGNTLEGAAFLSALELHSLCNHILGTRSNHRHGSMLGITREGKGVC